MVECIKEFAKANKFMTQIEIKDGIADTMADLKAISENVDNIVNNADVTNFVCGIPVGYSISNPVQDFL